MAFLLRYWKHLAAALVVVLVLGYTHHKGYEAGKAVVTAEWAEDMANRNKVDQKLALENAEKLAAAEARNEAIKNAKDKELASIAADRVSLAGRVRDYEDRLRALSSAQATDKLGLAVIAGIAERQKELDRRYDEYDKACQRDAVRFSALQEEVKGQM